MRSSDARAAGALPVSTATRMSSKSSCVTSGAGAAGAAGALAAAIVFDEATRRTVGGAEIATSATARHARSSPRSRRLDLSTCNVPPSRARDAPHGAPCARGRQRVAAGGRRVPQTPRPAAMLPTAAAPPRRPARR
eukprot:CAMPEP_0203811108 /NCGR_PEP_ID=MMETSP0115-20131106/3356_1 /ASSEMBLY_ACC=CAM_ASM_000227 /TAXON_ID=33651 /ORGANISM="Bicosoecid sp, Strain ms1" /LENGTH=135 /DNA_ID=CAMNT_0050719919 /DNA_START=1 /DNA_END=404 /DNA_ORIENTATION=-